MTGEDSTAGLRAELAALRARLAEAEETLRAIRGGEVDALVVAGDQGAEVHLLGAGDRIYRQFIETAGEGTATLSAAGAILSCNTAFAKTLRRPIDQVLGTAMRDHLSPDDQEIFSEVLAQAGRESRRRNIRLKTSEGRPVPVYLSASRLHGAGVEPVTCLVFTDLEEVVSAERALRESEIRYRLLFDQSPDGIVVIDPATARLLEFNETAHRQLGYSREEFAGLSISDIEDVETPAETRARIARVSSLGREDFETRHRTRDGEIRNVLVTAQSTEMLGIPVYHCVWRDVTEQHRHAEESSRLEAQLRQAQKVEAIGRLAGGVAHDFNNLTAIVIGYGEMLLGRLGPEDPTRKYAEQIVEAGRRSAMLTRQLLAFSRKQTLQPEVLDLNALLRNLEKMLGRVIGEDVELKFELAADPGRVTADPGQLEQVVTNLALNARDAMPLGGRLTVETADVDLDAAFALGHQSVVPGKYVLLALSDTGCGMDEATKSRLFEPFFTTKPKGKGTGLGLATAYGIVKQSGGYIWAYSEPGKGTAFKIYLPRTDAVPTVKVAEIVGETPRGGGERILLVEDEASLRELCGLVLARLGYRVSAAANGFEALALVREQGLEPDLVVTDVIMPGISGAETAERLGKVRPGLKVLYMSGYPDDAIARHGVLEPGTPFIQKPFTERALAAKVREALGAGTPAARAGRSVLMIDDDEQFRELVRHFCTKRGHTFTGVDSAAAALAALAGQSCDVLLVDLNIPGTSGADVLREIRAAGHAAPAIVLTGDVASADMDLLRPLGAVLALEKSSNAEPLLRAIEEA